MEMIQVSGFKVQKRFWNAGREEGWGRKSSTMQRMSINNGREGVKRADLVPSLGERYTIMVLQGKDGLFELIMDARTRKDRRGLTTVNAASLGRRGAYSLRMIISRVTTQGAKKYLADAPERIMTKFPTPIAEAWRKDVFLNEASGTGKNDKTRVLLSKVILTIGRG